MVAIPRLTTLDIKNSRWDRISPEMEGVILDALTKEPIVLDAELSQTGPDVFLGMLVSHPMDREQAKSLVKKGIRTMENATAKGMYWLVVRVYHVSDANPDCQPLPEREVLAEGRRDRDSGKTTGSGEYRGFQLTTATTLRYL